MLLTIVKIKSPFKHTQGKPLTLETWCEDWLIITAVPEGG